MCNDVKDNEEEEVVLYDASKEEEYEEEVSDWIERFMSDDEEESDKAFEELLNS